MRERMSDIWESVKTFWGSLSRKARILLLTAIFGVIILCVVLVAMLNHQTYALLYNDLTTTESAKVLTVLSELGIEPVVEPSGAIMVPEQDVNRARMQLASTGFPGSEFTYDTNNPGLTATQSDKNTLRIYQLQDRLQATIETFDEVAQAVVTISAPEPNAFALQTDIIPPSASVTIVKRPGRELTTAQVQGILNIVETSVPGISAENISITDENGDLKSALSANMDVNNNKLRLTEEVNSTIRNRILSMVQPKYGPGNVEVAVNTLLDTDSKVSEKTTYDPWDPENPTNNPLDYAEYDRQKVGDGTGVAEGVPGAQDNIGTPQYGEDDAELAATATYSSHDVFDYLVSSTKEQIVKEGLKIDDVTVAVVVNAKALADGERDQITAVVANASGAAVEKVTVQNWEFAKGADIPEDTVSGITPQRMLLYAGLGLILLIILVVVIIILVSKRKKDAEEELDDDGILYDENGMPLVDLMSQEEEFQPITIIETAEQKLKAQIKDLADSDPEIVAQLIKTWLVSPS